MANNGVEAAVQKPSAKLPSGIYEGSMIDELSACAKPSNIILVDASVSTSVCLSVYAITAGLILIAPAKVVCAMLCGRAARQHVRAS